MGSTEVKSGSIYLTHTITFSNQNSNNEFQDLSEILLQLCIELLSLTG